MNPKTIPPEFEMMKFILGKWVSKPIYVAAKLGLADILSNGNRHIEYLAKITETHSDSLYRLMRALSGVGIFFEGEGRVFANTALSECLKEGRLKASSLMFHSPWHDRIWDHLLFSIKSGESAFEKIYGESAFDWFKKNPEEAQIFHEANSYKAAALSRTIVQLYDFSVFKRITDVGGGLGGLIFEILKVNRNLEGIVADLPETLFHLQKTLEQKSVADRINFVGIDFFKEIPKGSDLYLLSNIIHDWPDEKSIIILNNCRKAISTDGRVLIIEAIIAEENTFSIAQQLDLEVLLMGGGRERTEDEFREIVKRADLRISKIIHTREAASVMECIPQ